MNREQWLNTAADAMRPYFAAHGYTIPQNVRVTCGWPSRSATSRRRRRIGECWSDAASAGRVFEIFISPTLSDPLEVAHVLAHELVHATVGLEAGHRGPFARLARAIGLEGPLTATVAGEAFIRWFTAAGLPAYPHDAMTASNRDKKQTTRLIKCFCPECDADGSPYIFRASRATLARGLPICPFHECFLTV